MGMIFCRGCAKEIHESAPACPHCGALQGTVNPNNGGNNAESGKSLKPHWTSITSLATAIVVFLLALQAPSERWDQNTVTGTILFSCVPIVFGIIALAKKHPGRWMAITGLVVGSIFIFVALGMGSP